MQQVCKFETKVNDRIYEFYCDPSSPIQDVKDALTNFLSEIVQIEMKAKEAQLKVEEESKKDAIPPEIETPIEIIPETT